jgi:protein-L-isoaspartate(D-aspartate) O-methyltransferase
MSLDLDRLSDAELYAVGILCADRDYGFGLGVPYRFAARPLVENPPFELSEEAADALLANLVTQGWLVRLPVEGREIEDIGASDAAMAQREALRSRLRSKHGDWPRDMGSVLLLHDALSEASGFERDTIRRCLEEPPVSLSGDAATKVYERLRDEGWIYALERTEEAPEWFPSPYLWACKQEVEAAVLALQPELRTKLATEIANDLELPPQDALRAALQQLDRAHFVGDEDKLSAYRNRPSLICNDGNDFRTTTSSPHVCATIVRALDIKPSDRVLVCGVKGGYTASLAALVAGAKGRVVALETDELIAAHARRSFERSALDPNRAQVVLVDDVTMGYEQLGPWDAVVVNGNIPKIPYSIIEQMNDGGRMLIFLHDQQEHAQRAVVIRKNEDVVKNEALSTFIFTPIYGRNGWDNLDKMQDDYRKAREGRAQQHVADHIERKVAYPLAKAFWAASSSGEASETHTRVLKAYECLVKFLAMPLCSLRDERTRSGGKGSDYVARILGRPAFGHWMAALRELAKEVDPQPYAAQLLKDLNRPMRDPELIAAAETTSQLVHGKPFGRPHITPMELLESVIAYRNRSAEGHGGIASTRHLEQRGMSLLGALGVLIVKLSVLQAFELVHISQVRTTREGMRISGLRLMGNTPRRVTELKPPTNAISPVDDMVVLHSPASGEWIDLHPWMLYGQGEREQDELFLFNEQSAGEARYTTYHDSNRYPPTTNKEFEAIRTRHTQTQPTASNLLDMLDTVLEDGRITEDEMRLLVKLARRERLADDDAEARGKIVAIAQQRLPGVIIE